MGAGKFSPSPVYGDLYLQDDMMSSLQQMFMYLFYNLMDVLAM